MGIFLFKKAKYFAFYSAQKLVIKSFSVTKKYETLIANLEQKNGYFYSFISLKIDKKFHKL